MGRGSGRWWCRGGGGGGLEEQERKRLPGWVIMPQPRQTGPRGRLSRCRAAAPMARQFPQEHARRHRLLASPVGQDLAGTLVHGVSSSTGAQEGGETHHHVTKQDGRLSPGCSPVRVLREQAQHRVDGSCVGHHRGNLCVCVCEGEGGGLEHEPEVGFSTCSIS